MASLVPMAVTAVFLLANAAAAKSADGDIALPPPGFAIDHARSDPHRPVRLTAGRYRGPLWDTHVHLDPPRRGGGVDPAALLAALDEAGVARITIMPTPNEGRFDPGGHNPRDGASGRQALRTLAPGRVRVFCGAASLTVWMHVAARAGYSEPALAARLGGLARSIDTGGCAGIGEIGLFHFRKWGHQAVIDIAPAFPPFLAVAKLAADKGVWLDLHAEPVEPEGRSREAEVFGAIALLYRQNPNLKLILSHTAMTNPANLRALLQTYPGLMVNWKLVRRHEKWRNLEPICDAQARLYQDWAALMEAFPERFMVGSDAKFGRKDFRLEAFQKDIKRIRRALGGLAPKAAEMIAWNNAVRVFGD